MGRLELAAGGQQQKAAVNWGDSPMSLHAGRMKHFTPYLSTMMSCGWAVALLPRWQALLPLTIAACTPVEVA